MKVSTIETWQKKGDTELFFLIRVLDLLKTSFFNTKLMKHF